MTNATKAQIVALVNAGLGILTAYGEVTAEQQAAIHTAVNAVLAAWIAFTYKRSHKRVPDGEAS